MLSVPSEPRSVTALNITSKSVSYTWDIPRYPNGIISYYKMAFDDLGPAYSIPIRCPDDRIPTKSIQEDLRTQNFQGLKPFNKYAFQVCASNSMIGEYSDVLVTITLPDSKYIVFFLYFILFDVTRRFTYR